MSQAPQNQEQPASTDGLTLDLRHALGSLRQAREALAGGDTERAASLLQETDSRFSDLLDRRLMLGRIIARVGKEQRARLVQISTEILDGYAAGNLGD